MGEVAQIKKSEIEETSNGVMRAAGVSNQSGPWLLGPYLVDGVIAKGGYGTVYLGKSFDGLGQARWVAVKVLHASVPGETTLRRLFVHEAKLATFVTHPNLCVPFDAGISADGKHYFVMDLVRGVPVAKVLTRLATMPIGERRNFDALSLWLIAEAARGLDAAHRAVGPDGKPLHVVHRDLCPPNLMLTFEGNVKVLDFGIARSVVTEGMSTGCTFRGHLAYSAPEQFRGGDVDARADVFSLGVILWELLTGRSCFRRECDQSTVRALLNHPPPDITAYRPDLPSMLSSLVMAALSADRDVRPQNAGRFAELIDCCLENVTPLMTAGRAAKHLAYLLPDEVSAAQARLSGSHHPVVDDSSASPGTSITLEEPLFEIDPTPTTVNGKRVFDFSVRTKRAAGVVALVALLGVFSVALPNHQTARPAALRMPEKTPDAPEIHPLAAPAVNDLSPQTEPSRVARSIPPRRRGRLAIVSHATWHRVWIDDRAAGETPLVTSVPVGRHWVRFENARGSGGRRIVWARAGKTTRMALGDL